MLRYLGLDRVSPEGSLPIRVATNQGVLDVLSCDRNPKPETLFLYHRRHCSRLPPSRSLKENGICCLYPVVSTKSIVFFMQDAFPDRSAAVLRLGNNSNVLNVFCTIFSGRFKEPPFGEENAVRDDREREKKEDI